MTFPPLRVFVSSTSEDLKPYRQAAREVIINHGWLPRGMEDFGCQPTSTVEFCKREVCQAQLVVLLVAYRRGWVPSLEEGGDGEQSITAIEVQAACSQRIPIL